MNQFENMGLLIEDTLSGKADSKVDNLSQAALDKTTTVQAKTATLRPYDPYTTSVSSGTDKGVLSASELESDVRNMAPDELYGKYGSAARNLLLGYANANAEVYRDSVIKSDQSIQDAGAAAVSAGLSGLGNVAAFLVDKVNSEAGVAIADRVAKADAAWTRNYLSDSVQSARKLQQTESELTSGDNAVLYEQDVANGSSEITAGAKEIGRNIFDVMANAIDDPRVLVDGTAQGVGSMLSYGPTGKVIEKAIDGVVTAKTLAGAAALDKVTDTALATKIADKAIDLAPTALAIGLTEGAGTYGGTVEQVMKTPFSAVLPYAPDSEIKREYQANLDANMNADEAFEKAKVTVASKAGNEAGNRQMAVASGLGLLTPYALNPFKVDSVKKAATNIFVAEPVEEAGQSLSGQLNQNIAIKDNVDPNQSLKKGLGEAAGEGALYGVGTAATFQAPKASVELLGMAGKATADLIIKGANKVADYGLAKEADIAAANSLKPEDTLNASEAIQTNLNTTETELATEGTTTPDQTVAFMGKLKQSMAIQDTDFADMPEEAVATLTGSKNRVDAVQRLAGLLYEETDDTKAAELAGHLQKLLEPIQEIKNTDSKVLAEVSTNEKVAMVISDYIQLSNTLEEAPFVKKAMDNFLAKVTPETVDTVVPTISESEVSTPKGQSAVRNALLLAQRAPEKNSLSGITAILKHARNGKLVLKDIEFKSLQASLALVQAAKDIEAHNKASGNKTPSNIVTGNILTDDAYKVEGGPRESASEYTRNIIAAMKSGNTELALDYLSEMAIFVEHMGNKVKALNTHYENGNTSAPPVSYMAINPARTGWADSMELHKKLGVGKYGGMFVNGVESIKMAQQIAFEAKTLTDIYNGLVTAFPEIGEVSAIVPTLNADLVGDATEVNNRIKASKTAPAKTSTETKAEVAPTKEVAPEPVVEPVVESKESSVTTKESSSKVVEDSANDKRSDTSTTEKAEDKQPTGDEAVKEAAALINSDNEDNLTVLTNDAVLDSAEAMSPGIYTRIIDRIRKHPALKGLMIFSRKMPGNAGAYSKNGHAIIFNSSVFDGVSNGVGLQDNDGEPSQVLSEIIVHEYIHAVTAKAIESSPEFMAELKEIQNSIKEWLKTNPKLSVSAKKALSYMAQDILEIPTYGMTDPDSQAVLKQIPSKKSGNLFNQFVSAVMNLLGLPNNSRSLLTDVIEVTDRIIADGEVKQDRASTVVNEVVEEKTEVETKEEVEESETTIEDEILENNQTTEEETETATEETSEIDEDVNNESKRVDTGLKALFPNLVQTVRNYFYEVYTLPSENPISRFSDSGMNPLEYFLNAIQNKTNIYKIDSKGIQRKNIFDETLSAYRSLLVGGITGPSVYEVMSYELDALLQKHLNLPIKKGSNRLRKDSLVEGTANITSYEDGVSLSLTEVDPLTGEVSFNDYLKEAALLAGLQYVMTMNQKGSQVNDLDLPTDLDDQTAKEVRAISNNVSRDSAISELSNKIMRYWGIKGHPDGDLGYVLGISQAMAANVLQAMEAVGMLSFQSVSYVKANGEYVTLTAMVPSPDIKILPDSPLAQYRDLIDDVVLYEPDRVIYLEDDVVPVAEDQLNNFGFKNTLEQKAAIEQAQKVEFKINETVAQLLLGMGKDGMIELMSQSTDKPLNINEKESIEGVNLGLVHAFEEMELMIEDAKSVSAKKKKSIFEVIFKFAMNMSKVARLQMQGSYTPQSSKLIRAMLTPTWATIDMNDVKAKQVFFAGYAQATGVKIEQFSLEEVSEQVLANIQGKHKKLLDKFREHVRYSPSIDQTAAPVIYARQLKDLAKEAGIPLSFDGIHALVEMAKYLEASDVSNFRTSMFVEADGKTNGPLNALMLYSIGSFNPTWLKMIRKGGVGIGEAKPMHRMDLTDLYKVTADSLGSKVKKVISFIQSTDKNGKVVNNLSATYTLLNTLLPDFSMEFDSVKGEFTIEAKRGVIKNPLTITIYGSGTYGLASKIAEIIEGELYSLMSLQLQNQTQNPKMPAHEAMFPDNPDSERVYKQMMDSLEILRRSNAYFHKKDGIYRVADRKSQVSPLGKNPKTFTLDGGDMNSITQNLKALFVGPMHQSIWGTMGKELSGTMDAIGQYTDTHSWFYTQLYNIEVNEALEAKKKLDPQAKYLSQRELTEIRRKLAKFAPIIQNGGQHFLISKSKIDREGGKEFSKSLGGMSIIPGMRLPATTGVAGKAFMTIGSGDAKTIQQALVEYELENSLYLFDGVNIGVDKAVDYSNKLNQATVDSWMVNTLDGLAASSRKINQLLTPAVLDKLQNNLPFNEAVLLTEKLTQLASSEATLTRLATVNAARIQVLKEVPLFSDQMAALSAVYSTQPNFVGNLDDLDIVEVMNNRLHELMGGIVPSELSKLSAYARVDANSGAKIISFPSLWDMATNANSEIFTKDQKAVLIQLLASKEAKDYKIVFGSIAEIQSYNIRNGLPQIGLDEGDSFNGVTLPAQKTILIVSNKQGNEAEVLVHELLHASTINKVIAAYEGNIAEGDIEITEAAIKRLEGLMAEFLDLPTDDMPAETKASIESAKQAIQDQLADLLTDPVQSKAYALNEFMAWTLTNQEIVSELKTRAAPAILRIAKEVFEFLRTVIFGEKSKVKLGNDFYSQIRFNSSIVLKAEVTVNDIFTENALYHRNGNTSKANLTRLSSALQRLIAETDKPFLATGIPNKNLAKAIQLGVDMTRRVAPHFKLTAEEESMFELVTTALGTELALNPAALTKAQQLYDHVIQNLTTADFLDDSIVDINVREARANEQYNVLLGRYYREQDNLGRSTLLSTFIGLTLVSDEVRKALNGMVLPKQVSSRETTVDALLENFGNSLLDSLTSAVTSDKKDRSVVGAIDAMMEGITESVLDDKSKIEKASQWTGELLDTGNAKLVKMLNAAGAKGLKSAKQLAQSNNRITRAAGYMLSGFSALASSQVGAEVSENIIESINKTKMPQFLYEFLNDIVGSVDSNRDVYGLIKVVKSSIQRVRQNFRVKVPKVISEKFKTDPSKQQWESLHQSLGKTDFALLVQTHGADKAIEYMTNDQSRAARIAEIQKEMVKLSPRMYAAVRNDVDKLAQYMATGKTSTMLLRNAYSIANAASVPMGRVYTEADVKLIDELVSLEALGKLSPESVDTVKLLAGTELDGLKFVADYLVGQRKGEMEKATKGAAKYNHYKGWVPVEYGVGGSLIIADDATAGELITKGYRRVGDYKGSGADPYALKKGYYYTDTSGKPAYSQGIFQNIKQTASGVDELTGFTSGIVAGRVMGKVAVKQVLNRLQFETGSTTEHLIPVYDENGSIIGFERPAAADKLELLKPSKELHKMVGNWRGRQVEEYKAQAFNRITVDRLNTMRVEDLKKNPSSIKGYVDLLNLPADVINEYGFKLITPQTIQYIKDTYGDVFLVRKDVLMDVLGYPNPSVSDYWTGNSRLSKEWLDFGRGVFISLLGKDAFTRMVKTEQSVMGVVSAVRNNIVIRSILVPISNMLSTARQLLARGHTIYELATGIPAKLVEIRQYVKGNLDKVKLEAELRATHNDPKKEMEIKNRVLALEGSFKRMSIWPLIEAGEFSTIADVGMSEADLEISSGNFIGFIENQINKLPPMFRTLAKYGIISKDTALFDGLQKSVQYTDFIAKAIMYDKMTGSKNMEPAKALGIISEEFVNYDRLAGRTRTGLENLGLFWFGNFKIRSVKVALSMIRENPLHTLIAMALPFPTGSELPTTENIIYKMFDTSITGSMGPGMIVDSLDLNPWMNITR